MKTRLTAERESEVRSREFEKQDVRAEEIKRAHNNMGFSVRNMSTRLPSLDNRVSSREAATERRNLTIALSKLKAY